MGGAAEALGRERDDGAGREPLGVGAASTDASPFIVMTGVSATTTR